MPRDASPAGPLLLAVPNVSEGGDETVVRELAAAFAPARLLDLHLDPDHGRSVLTLAARQRELAEALLTGARAVVERLDLRAHAGLHPHVGALDVAPVVFLDETDRGAASAVALTSGNLIGEELGLPVFLYGGLATDPSRSERAALRRGGPAELGARLARGELRPDFGPARLHPTAGAVLMTARPPLVAFNLDLATTDVALAREIAAELRESAPGGLAGVKALGLFLPARGRAQVTFNVEDHRAVPLRVLVERVRARAEVAEAELVGLAPAAAFDGFPADLPVRAPGPRERLIEHALGSGR